MWKRHMNTHPPTKKTRTTSDMILSQEQARKVTQYHWLDLSALIWGKRYYTIFIIRIRIKIIFTALFFDKRLISNQRISFLITISLFLNHWFWSLFISQVYTSVINLDNNTRILIEYKLNTLSYYWRNYNILSGYSI